MKAPELKGCPWCGYHNACPTTDDDGFHFVECGTCMARGPISRSNAKAVELWNAPADFARLP